LALSAAYISFLWNAGLLSRIALDRLWLNNLFRPVTARDRWKAVNVTVYWMAFMAVLIAGCTGISMNLFPNTADIPLIAMVHRTAAWSIPLYVVLHVLALTAMGGVSYLLKIIRPRPAFGIAALVAVCTGGATTLAYWGVEEAMQNGLPVTRVQQGPALDGKADDKIWGDVKQADIRTSRGANGDDGGTIVTIMAVHDGTHIYTLFQWEDSTRSQKHLPMVKTADGWRVTQTEFGIQDEDSYYERPLHNSILANFIRFFTMKSMVNSQIFARMRVMQRSLRGQVWCDALHRRGNCWQRLDPFG
jgi:hypothetical protein